MARNVVGIPYQNPRRYVGPFANLIPIVRVSRAPTSADKKYPLGQFWMVGENPSTGSEGDLWYLCEFTSGNATWCQVAVGAGSPGIDTITGDGGTAVSPDVSGNVDWNAATVANGTNAKPLYINDGTANTIIPQIQLGAAITGAPADANDAGIVSFDDTAFAVSANGYVTLVGGGSSPALLSLDIDGTSGTGTDPVVANGSGVIALTGAAVANATYASPVFTNSGTANSATVAVQVGAAVTGAPGDKLDAGLVSFDDTAFAVDTNGYVTLVGGGTTPAMVSLNVDGNTAPGTDPVVANGSAQITLTGSTVANATNATPVFTHSRAANTANVEVQVAAAITGAPGDKNDAGLCSFNDTDFTVDSDGYVSLASGATSSVVQMVSTRDNTPFNTSVATPVPDGSIPQQTEGTELMTLSITPQSASNILVIDFFAGEVIDNTGTAFANAFLFQDATADCLCSAMTLTNNNYPTNLILKHRMVAGTTSSTTFKIRVSGSGTLLISSGTGGTALYGGTEYYMMQITEYTP